MQYLAERVRQIGQLRDVHHKEKRHRAGDEPHDHQHGGAHRLAADAAPRQRDDEHSPGRGQKRDEGQHRREDGDGAGEQSVSRIMRQLAASAKSRTINIARNTTLPVQKHANEMMSAHATFATGFMR